MGAALALFGPAPISACGSSFGESERARCTSEIEPEQRHERCRNCSRRQSSVATVAERPAGVREAVRRLVCTLRLAIMRWNCWAQTAARKENKISGSENRERGRNNIVRIGLTACAGPYLPFAVSSALGSEHQLPGAESESIGRSACARLPIAFRAFRECRKPPPRAPLTLSLIQIYIHTRPCTRVSRKLSPETRQTEAEARRDQPGPTCGNKADSPSRLCRQPRCARRGPQPRIPLLAAQI